MPRATVAATLRARIITACGPAVDMLAQRLLAADEGVRQAAEGIDASEGRDAQEAALRLLRNAQAGRAIRGLAGGEVGSLTTRTAKGEEVMRYRSIAGMAEASEALRLVVMWLAGRGLDGTSEALAGVVKAGRVVKPGLLWELAFACNLRFCGDSMMRTGEEVIAAAESGEILTWIEAMDDFLVSPAEIEILWAFCLLHTFRPF